MPKFSSIFVYNCFPKTIAYGKCCKNRHKSNARWIFSGGHMVGHHRRQRTGTGCWGSDDEALDYWRRCRLGKFARVARELRRRLRRRRAVRPRNNDFFFALRGRDFDALQSCLWEKSRHAVPTKSGSASKFLNGNEKSMRSLPLSTAFGERNPTTNSRLRTHGFGNILTWLDTGRPQNSARLQGP